ncbi:hypothetical protein F4801DRAFT_534570 [Xylaria longipes]|nr:hypothetical protein F4801DRAFT_534570 [Xylaria longipes]
MPRGHTSRHMQTRGRKPACMYYSAEAFQKYLETPLQHDNDDDVRLQDLRQRWSTGICHQADQELFNEITARNEELEELRRTPLRQELESYFDDLNLDPLPPPLPKRSEWLDTTHSKNYRNAEVRPFFIACEEGSLEVVKEWVSEKREVLLQVGVQDGLACAARENQVDVVRYLFDEGGAFLDGSVIEGACFRRSLPLFELCVQHGYHPNQQIPSNDGYLGVALNHCLDNREITLFLLKHGADPDLAPFQDCRRFGWGRRATPPMDRKCGLALDRAVVGSSFAIIQMLLEYGANPTYSRPLHGVVRRRRLHIATTQDQQATDNENKDDWRPVR